VTEEQTLFDDEEPEDLTRDQEDPLNLEHRERRLVTQPYDLSVSTLVDDIKKDRLLLNIEYQRQYISKTIRLGSRKSQQAHRKPTA
jgi:hypothetical protein